MVQQILPVILAGGRGTRLWPLSTDDKPKQFLPLYGNYSLLQQTIRRLDGQEKILPPVIVSNANYEKIIGEQLAEIGIDNAVIFLEPIGRNTAPAIVLAALFAQQTYDNPTLLVLPSDHYIEDIVAFQAAIIRAVDHADEGKLVTFGINPTNPATGYGYIKGGSEIDNNSFHVAEFTEKPALEIAKEYLRQGNYYWNSGMFVFQTDTLLDEIELHADDILIDCETTFANRQEMGNVLNFNQEDFSKCQSISIDYAVMEKTNRAIVLPLSIGWSDLGGWRALWEISEKDGNGNVIKGDEITLENTYNSFILSDKTVTIKDQHSCVVVDCEFGSITKKM